MYNFKAVNNVCEINTYNPLPEENHFRTFVINVFTFHDTFLDEVIRNRSKFVYCLVNDTLYVS